MDMFGHMRMPDMTLTVEQSETGTVWTALAASTAGGPLTPADGVTVEEMVLQDVTMNLDKVIVPRDVAGRMFRLRIRREP